MTLVSEAKAHRIGDPEWNRVYAALRPFVSGLTDDSIRQKCTRMTDAVMEALRAARTQGVEESSGAR